MKEKHKPMKKLRAIRRAADITQRELAEKVGCHENAINGYEKGTHAPSLKMLYKLAAALNCEARDLI